MKKIISVIICIMLLFIVSACNGRQRNIVDVSFDQTVLDSSYEVSNFNIEDYFLTVTYSDGSTNQVAITDEMISSSDHAKLSESGTKTITVFYQGYEISITVNLTDSTNELLTLLMSIYNTGVSEGNIMDMTYEEWVDSIRGEQGLPGTDGREVQFQVSGGYIQWKYSGDETWMNLIDLATLTGEDGINGTDGTDGREVLFQVSGGYIQWKYSGDETWINLIEIATLTGVQGVGIDEMIINEYGELIITYTDDTEVNLGQIYVIYTVNFVGKDGYLIDTQKILYGEDAIEPTPPIVEGYTFIDWSRAFTNITTDLTIYAYYDINSYTINFDSNGGSSIDSIIDIEYGTILSLPVPIREGYYFSGWYLGMEANDDQFTNQSPITDNLTLYARWSIQQNMVLFVDADDVVLKAVMVPYGGETTPPIAPDIAGYTFIDWSGSYWNITENRIIKALYEINSYSISYVTFDNYYAPLNDIPLNAGENIIQISLGYYHSVALTSEGRIFTWGYNYYGQLGDGTTTDRSIPTEITSQFNLWPGETITQVSLGSGHSSAITTSGRIFAWGRNDFGQLGDGTTTNKSVPTEITCQFSLLPEETIVQVSFGHSHSSAITSNGRIFTWGKNYYGQLGDGTTIDKSTPTEITSQFSLLKDETIFQVSLSYYHSSAITSNGRIFTWGSNSFGQLGDGTTIDKSVPTEITQQFPLSEKETLTQVSLGDYHSSAITSEGRIFAWGYNSSGQLGDGTTTNKSTPTEITSQFGLLLEETIAQVSLGVVHSSAITSSGRVFTWGDNGYGQLGDGTIIDKSIPTEITSQFSLLPEETIIKVFLGGNHSSAITGSGRILTWGRNEFGQLGDGTTINKYIPNLALFGYSTLVQVDTFEYLDTIISYEMPEMPGYTFDGWYSDAGLTQAYTFTIMPAEDITLYGKWNLIIYEITYYLDGGVNGSNPSTYTIETPTITLDNPTKEGYTFNGWFNNADFTGEAITEIAAGSTEDIVLYAKWTIT